MARIDQELPEAGAEKTSAASAASLDSAVQARPFGQNLAADLANDRKRRDDDQASHERIFEHFATGFVFDQTFAIANDQIHGCSIFETATTIQYIYSTKTSIMLNEI